ncbi:B12-binding domain-containing radical SAM protein [Magnetospira thiophila]
MSLRYPESLLAVASVPVSKGYDTVLVDQRVSDDFEGDLARAVGPETVVFGVTAITGEQIKYALKVSRLLKEKYPRIPVCWGGIHATLVPEQTASHELVDYVVVGDGEYVFCELFERLRDGQSLEDLRGLVYKTGDADLVSTAGQLERQAVGKKDSYIYVRKNGSADVIRDMDALPPIPYELLQLDKYNVFHVDGNFRSATLNTSRGCPFRCKFCSDPVINEGRWRGYSAEVVIKKVRELYDRYGVRMVYFQDDYFPGSKKRFISILNGLAEFGRDLKWSTLGIRADTLSKLTDEEWDLLWRSGCHSLEVGIESGNERVLKALSKGETLEEMRVVNERLANYDIKVKYTLIVGFPGESEAEIKDSLKFAADLEAVNPHAYCLIFNFMPIIGTPFYHDALAEGFKEPQTLEEWAYMDFDKWLQHYQGWAAKDKIGWLQAVNFVSYFHNKNVGYKFGNSPLLRFCFMLYHPVARWRFNHSFYDYCFEIKLQRFLVATKFALRRWRQSMKIGVRAEETSPQAAKQEV